MTFSELRLAEPLLRALTAEGYSTPTPIQAQAIPAALEGRDVLGCAQTGTGKTAAFALPLLQHLLPARPLPRDARRPIRALILAPTRELAVQIAESFDVYGRHSGLKVATIYGGVGYERQIQACRRGVDVLVATPGRLVDLLQQGHGNLSTLTHFVLDEADRMLDMGFLPDLRRIMQRLPANRQTLFFSATMPAEIERLAQELLEDPVRIDIAPAQPTADRIEQSVCFVARAQKSALLAQRLTDGTVARAIVFTRTKHGADRVARQLETAGVRAEAIHGNKSQNARQRTLQAFRANVLQVLVATDLAARGIDVDGISHVFNYDLPHEPETYVHRIGRTARAGASGQAISFCDAEERGLLRGIERLLKRRLPVEATPTLPVRTTAAPAAGAPRTERPQGGPQRSQPPRREPQRPGGDRRQRSEQAPPRTAQASAPHGRPVKKPRRRPVGPHAR